jgi:hypothetical protein
MGEQTRSERLIAFTRVLARRCQKTPEARELCNVARIMADEYEIAIAQNLRLEESIHVLCKSIYELPSA